MVSITSSPRWVSSWAGPGRSGVGDRASLGTLAALTERALIQRLPQASGGTAINQVVPVTVVHRLGQLCAEGVSRRPRGAPRVAGPPYRVDANGRDNAAERFCESFDLAAPINEFPLVVIVDDSQFAAGSLNNFLWATFTRSNPAADVHGVGSFTEQKHWGCRGSMVIDARIKEHLAPALETDPATCRKVDALAAPGGPLHGVC